MKDRKRTHKVTGDRKDAYIIRLCHDGNKMFRRVRILNTRRGDKNKPSAEVILDQQSHGLLFTRKNNNRTEVCGFVDEKTGLFVMDMEGDTGDTAHIKFLKNACTKVKEAVNDELLRQGREDDEIRDQNDYYSPDRLSELIDDYLYNPARFNADLGKQLTHFASRPMPNVNEYMVFADDDAWNEDIYITRRVPYANPANRTLKDDEKKTVDGFLDVFFDEYNKQAFSWYMGACLLNLPIYDERVSRLGVMTSSHGGSGKSSLMAAIMNGVFTEDFCAVKPNFDRFFLNNNRFGADSLSVKRLSVYSEADWGVERDGDNTHSFDGLNVSAIKSLITDGYITKEPKFGDPATVRSSGFHMVLTNHLPCVTREDVAMRRRILPIIMRPTSMVDKAEKLNLLGRDALEKFVADHAEIFAAYFVKTFMDNQYLYIREEYDFSEETTAVQDSQEDLDEEDRENREALTATKSEGFVSFAKKAQEQTGIDLSLLISDAQFAVGGKAPDGVDGHMRRDETAFYIDGSKSFLMRYGRSATLIRKLLQTYYGPSVRKYHKRMFVIPLGQAKKYEENE